MCEPDFEKWLLDLFYWDNENTKYAQFIKNGIVLLRRDYGIKNKLSIVINQEPHHNDKWPEFYIGNFKWVKPDPFELKTNINISNITWVNGMEILQKELFKLKITILTEKQM